MLVTVESIISVRDFGTIFSASPVDAKQQKFRVRAEGAGMLGHPAVGETWYVEGLVAETNYGPQMAALVAYRTLPNGDGIRRYIAAHVPGVGEDRARRLWERFGENLSTVLADERNIEVIAETIAPGQPNFGVRLAAATIRGWQTAAAEAKLVDWLMRQGVADLQLVRKVSSILGNDAVARLEANPWVLVSLMPWRRVDELGLRLLLQAGVDKHRTDTRRLVGAVDALVKARLEGGHTALEIGWLRRNLARLLGVTENSETIKRAVEAGVRNGGILATAHPDIWRAPGAALMEDAVVKRMKEMLASSYLCPLDIPNVEELIRIADSVCDPLRPLHFEQRSALVRVLQKPLACLQGGAGVGKTYTLRVVCDVFERLGGRLVLCALAGKAALQLSSSTGRPASTLARLINELDERAHLTHELPSFPAHVTARSRIDQQLFIDERTLVVIDEASMVDLATCHTLLRRMPQGARLLFTGDEAQLPPVGFGLVYHLLVADSSITASMAAVHRQSAESGIPAVSAAIRRREIPLLKPYQGKSGGVTLLESRPDAVAQAVQKVWFDLGGYGSDVLIVAPTNDGAAGVRQMNRSLHERYLSDFPAPEVKGYDGNYFSVGEPVMFLRNDYSRSLFNGLLGRITGLDEETRALDVMFDGETTSRRMTPEDLMDLRLAYALTCHKAQGSQASCIVVPLYESRVLNPSWMYTAITRAEQQVVLVGSAAVFSESLRLPWTDEHRLIGLRW